MYAVGDTHSHMFPVGDGRGEEDLCHVRSGGCSVTHVPSGGWERRGGSLPCTQWGDTHSHMFPVGDGGGEDRGSVPCTQWRMPSGTYLIFLHAVPHKL